jgi:predicted adenylyl cyclase CyaB
MHEVELKIRCRPGDAEKIVDYCERAGYEFAGEEEQEDVYFTPCHRNIFEQDQALRLRCTRSGKKVEWFVTYKGANTNPFFHSRQELETVLADGRVFAEILDLLDFKRFLRLEKKRRTYRKGNISIALDKVEALGEFAEIEYLSEGDQAFAEKKINEVTNALNIENMVLEKKNYLRLMFEEINKGVIE